MPAGAASRAIAVPGATLIFLVVVALGSGSDLALSARLPITPWNPEAGFILAVLILYPRLALVPVSAGMAAVALIAMTAATKDFNWRAAVCVVAITCVGYAIGASLLRNRRPALLVLDSPADVAMLLAIAAGVAIVVTAAQSFAYVTFGSLSVAELPGAAVILAVGDIIGIVVVCPVVLRYAAGPFRAYLASRIDRPIATIGWLTLTASCVFLVFGLEATDEFKFFYVLFLPIIAIAMRHGIDGALIGLPIVQAGMIGLLTWREFAIPTIVELQILLLTLSITGLLVGAAVTARRRADANASDSEERLRGHEARLRQIARLNVSGEMASAIAHEVSQPLTACRAFMRAAARRMAAGTSEIGAARSDIDAAVQQIDLASDVIRRLRRFLQRGEEDRSPARIEDIMREAVRLMERSGLQQGQMLTLDIDGRLPPVTVDRVQILQVLLNLMRNAIEAQANLPGRRAPIRISAAQDRDATGIEIAVRDGGPGIASDIRASLFEPFVTTKPMGLGLGLAICRTIVEAHGGRIWLAQSSATGTEFRFFLPAQASGGT